ncbi:MAG: hypothetical protein PHW77_06380 [Eubacteriales bacterium]|nr:hypothetical protein [Eubacteriales bacterium]
MIGQKLRAFMYGRYGMDQLNMALLILCSLLILVNFFVNSYILSLIATLIVIWETFRALSKKHYARQKENTVFLKFWAPTEKWIRTRYTRFKERNVYKYRTCPNCKATLRLPAKKGRHTTKCPKCATEFSVRI